LWARRTIFSGATTRESVVARPLSRTTPTSKSLGIDYTCPPVYSFTTMNTLLLLVALAAPFVLLGAAVAALIVIIGRRTSR